MKNILKDYIFSFFRPVGKSDTENMKKSAVPDPVYLIDHETASSKRRLFSYGVAMGGYSRRDIDEKTELGRLIHAMKYKYLMTAADELSELSVAFLRRHPLPRVPDQVVLIPDTLVNRPFRPNAAIAAGISDYFGAQLFEKAIYRVRFERPQKGRSIAERLSDDLPRFGVDPGYDPSGKVVLIFDDIYDTGKSISEAAGLILQSAPADVMVFTLVRLGVRSG